MVLKCEGCSHSGVQMRAQNAFLSINGCVGPEEARRIALSGPPWLPPSRGMRHQALLAALFVLSWRTVASSVRLVCACLRTSHRPMISLFIA